MKWFHKNKRLTSSISILLVFCCFLWGVPSIGYAQQATLLDRLPTSHEFVRLTDSYNPAQLRGIEIVPNNPFRLNFIIEQGDNPLKEEEFKAEAYRLVKYFMAALTIPEKDLWVNLSPYEKNRIIVPEFAVTEMGRNSLAQDYVLKQLTASLMYPESGLGKKFWERVYQRVGQQYGRTDIPVNTFNKVWITPQEAIIYEKGQGAYVAYTHLKVMLEEDYLAGQKHGMVVSKSQAKSMSSVEDDLSKNIVREVILPEIEKEVNEGKNFARLRQIFDAIVLATWFKNSLSKSPLGAVYANQKKVNGIDLVDSDTKGRIYKQYLDAYKKGVYNFIKEDQDMFSHQTVARKYFAGGFWADGTSRVTEAFSSFDEMPLRGQEGLLGDTRPAREFVFNLEQTAADSDDQSMLVSRKASQEAINRSFNLEQLEGIVRDNKGVKTVVVITNIGDEEIVKRKLEADSSKIFRADGKVQIVTIGTVGQGINRGQFGAILHVQQELKRLGIKNEGVILGVLIPGQGTRMSPFTQRQVGIKPLISFGLRTEENGKFLNALEASAYSWNLVAFHLARMGFQGSAWKWGDEPQIPSNVLAALNKDLSDVDAVRFAAPVEVTDDLAENKEWFLLRADGSINKQLHRRSKSELLQALGLKDKPGVMALAHIGSPSFSNLFLDEAAKIFGDIPDVQIDVDGYLFEALTYNQQEWNVEVSRDKKLQDLIAQIPDFYERVQRLRSNVEAVRGKKMKIEIIDFGAGLYWGDIGQLKKARQTYDDLRAKTELGDFARKLVKIDRIEPDAFGNIVVNSDIPRDGSVRNSVVINTTIHGKADVNGAVLINSEFGELTAREGAVAVESTIGRAEFGSKTFSYGSLKSLAKQDKLVLPDNRVHTSMLNDDNPDSPIIENWQADLTVDVGSKPFYDNPQFDNPRSFRAEQRRVRERGITPDLIEERMSTLFRAPLHEKMLKQRNVFRQKALKGAMSRPAVTAGLPLAFDEDSKTFTTIKGLPRVEDVLPTTSSVADVTRQLTILLNVQNNVFNPQVREAASFLQALAFFRQLLPQDRDAVVKDFQNLGFGELADWLVNNRNLRIDDLAKQVEKRFGIAIGERELNHIMVYDETVTRARGLRMVLETAPFQAAPSEQIVHTLTTTPRLRDVLWGIRSAAVVKGLSDQDAQQMGPVLENLKKMVGTDVRLLRLYDGRYYVYDGYAMQVKAQENFVQLKKRNRDFEVHGGDLSRQGLEDMIQMDMARGQGLFYLGTGEMAAVASDEFDGMVRSVGASITDKEPQQHFWKWDPQRLLWRAESLGSRVFRIARTNLDTETTATINRKDAVQEQMEIEREMAKGFNRVFPFYMLDNTPPGLIRDSNKNALAKMASLGAEVFHDTIEMRSRLRDEIARGIAQDMNSLISEGKLSAPQRELLETHKLFVNDDINGKVDWEKLHKYFDRGVFDHIAGVRNETIGRTKGELVAGSVDDDAPPTVTVLPADEEAQLKADRNAKVEKAWQELYKEMSAAIEQVMGQAVTITDQKSYYEALAAVDTTDLRIKAVREKYFGYDPDKLGGIIPTAAGEIVASNDLIFQDELGWGKYMHRGYQRMEGGQGPFAKFMLTEYDSVVRRPLRDRKDLHVMPVDTDAFARWVGMPYERLNLPLRGSTLNTDKKEGDWRLMYTSTPRKLADFTAAKGDTTIAVVFQFGHAQDTSGFSQMAAWVGGGKAVPGLAGEPVEVAGIEITGVKQRGDIQHPNQSVFVGPQGVTGFASLALNGIFNRNFFLVGKKLDDGTVLPLLFLTPGKNLRTEEPYPFKLFVRAMLEGKIVVAAAPVVGDQHRSFGERMYIVATQDLTETIAMTAREPYEEANKLLFQELPNRPDLQGQGKEYDRLTRLGELVVEQAKRFSLSDEKQSSLLKERNVRAMIMAHLGQYYMAKAKLLESEPTNEQIKQELRDISLVMLQYADEFKMYHVGDAVKADYGRVDYRPKDGNKDYFYRIKRKGGQLTWEAVSPDIKVERVNGIVQASHAEWNPLQGRQGRVAIPMTKSGEPIEIALESGSGIILRDMLEDGQEAIVPVMRSEYATEFLSTVERQAKAQILEDGESLLLWPFMVKHFVSWRDEKAAEIDQRTPDAKLKPSSRGGIEIQFNEAEGNRVSFTNKWSLPTGQTMQFVRLEPGKRVNIDRKPNEQAYVNVIKGELTNINRGVFAKPNTARSTLLPEDVDFVVAGPQGAIIQIVTTPKGASVGTDMEQLLFNGPLAKTLDWKNAEDLPWWKGAKGIDLWNAPGFHIMDGTEEAAYVQFWKAGPGVNAGEHDHSGDITNPFIEKHLILSGTGVKMIVKDGISIPVNPGEEHGYMGRIDPKTGQPLRRPDGTVQYPLHSFQAPADQTVFWEAVEIHPDRNVVVADMSMQGDKALRVKSPVDKFGGIDLTGKYNLSVRKEAGAQSMNIPSDFLQGIDIKGLIPVLINDKLVVIPKLLELEDART